MNLQKQRRLQLIITFLFVGSLLSGFTCFSQTEDQLLQQLPAARHDTDRIKIYILLHNAVFKNDILKAQEYATQILRNAQEAKSVYYEFIAYRALARCGRKYRDYDVVLHYDTLAMQIAKKINTPVALFTAHIDFATDYTDGDQYKNVLPHLQACAAIADAQNIDSAKAKVQNRLGWYYKTIHMYSQSLPHFENAMKVYTQLNDKKMLAHTGRGYAEALMVLGKTDKVPRMLFDAIEYYRNTNTYYSLAQCLAILGESHFRNGNLNKGLENLLEAKTYFTLGKNLPEEGSVTGDIASTYLMKKDFDKAKQYGNEAMKLMTLANYEYGLTTLNTFWGQYYTLLHKLDSADMYFRRADFLTKKNMLQDRETENLRYWSVLKYMQKDKHSGDSLLLQYSEKIRKERDPAAIAYDVATYIRVNHITDPQIIKSLSLSYTKDGIQQLKNVMNSGDSANIKRIDSTVTAGYEILPYTGDSATELANYKELMRLETQYKTRIKDDSIRLQKQQAIISQKEIKTKNITIAATSVLLLLVAAGLWLQFHYRRRAERDKAKIELLQNEIHHRVKNNLAVINRLVEVAGKNSVEDAPLLTLKNRIKSIELLHNHLYSNEAKTGNISLQSYFEDLCLAIAATFQTAKHIEINVQAPTEVDSTIAEKLGLILNELVTNSFKYAFENKEKGAITVTAKPEGKQLNMIVQDNGIGMATEKSVKSYGMKLIKGLSNELNGKFTFTNMGGTAFQLSIPVSA